MQQDAVLDTFRLIFDGEQACAHAQVDAPTPARAPASTPAPAPTPARPRNYSAHAPAHPRMATQLKDDRTVSDYKIGMESTIFLVDYTPRDIIDSDSD